ncbi:MAG: endonuclease III [Candidatus Aenigmarchaeota archaeon]|nr:endonuclease III [Candidatus Aenigmarchaeota archaeon]
MKIIIKFIRSRYGKRINEFLERNIDPFELLITTVLSQRTKDENTAMASERLFSVVTCPEEIIRMEDKTLENLIKPSGTYREKAKRIKQISKIVVEKYNGKSPRTRKELMSLPGVGPKTADVVLSYGFGVPNIPVDVHVEVCSKRLGLVDQNAKYEEIRKTLESLVSEKERFLVNVGFVNFGKEICRTHNPKCGICPLNDICDFHRSKRMG